MGKTNVNTGGRDPYKSTGGQETWTQEMLEAYLASSEGDKGVFTPPPTAEEIARADDIDKGDTTRLDLGLEGIDIQGRIMPLTEQEKQRAYSDTKRTRIGGKKGLSPRSESDIFSTPDGVNLSYAAVIENLQRRQTPGDLGPLNNQLNLLVVEPLKIF